MMIKLKAEAPKILVVDDEKNYRIILSRLLEGSGYQVLLADSPDSAMSILRQEQVSLILSDLRMKNVDGLNFCRQVLAEIGQIPCVVFSASASEYSKQEIKKAGIHHCLIKPFRNQDVLRLVNDLLAQPFDALPIETVHDRIEKPGLPGASLLPEENKIS